MPSHREDMPESHSGGPGNRARTPEPPPNGVHSEANAQTASGEGAQTAETLPDSGAQDEDGVGDVSERIIQASDAVRNAERGARAAEGVRAIRVVNKAGDVVREVNEQFETAQSVGTSLRPVYESDALKKVREGINSLAESIPGLLKALDEVAKIHPFIQVAVGAFKVVVELDLKRRDNDKKINVLFLEMKDMMEVLLELRSVKDEETRGPDGTTIKARMQELVKRTADDIKDCANACDTYAKERLLVKVIKSSSWDDKLKSYMTLFADRRKAFTFALEMHVGRAVDDVNRAVASMDAKLDIVLGLFSSLVTPEQRELGELVRSKGGPTAVMVDNKSLDELMKVKLSAAEREAGAGHLRQQSDSLEALKAELFDSPDAAIRRNFELFERKFTMQQRELADEMRGVVEHETDRVIEAIMSGPHDKIKDRDIYEVWKEMRWRGHVKARHFILALRDHYVQKIEEFKRGEGTDPRVKKEDEGFLDFIDVSRLQAITEAFDDDTSGLITIAEVNNFTSSRPKGWGIAVWIAYWALGWQVSMTSYIDNIVEIFAKMFALLPRIRPENKKFAYDYLCSVWQPIVTLTAAFNGAIAPDIVSQTFRSYVEAEEERLRQSLETVRYNIDALDTLRLITGPGRIEKCLFPLLHLLLKRDYDIFCLSQKVVISKDEFPDSADTLLCVLDGVQYRHDALVVLFKQQKLDPAEQFKTFAYGLFEHWHKPENFWSMENLQKVRFSEVESVDEIEIAHLEPDKVLNHPLPMDCLYSPRTESEPPEPQGKAKISDALNRILGRWNGFFGWATWPCSPMVTFSFEASQHDNLLQARSVAANGVEYTILGHYEPDDNGVRDYSFTRVFADNTPTQYLIDEQGNGEVLSGCWGRSVNRLPNRFYFSRLPQEVLKHRPSPDEFKRNKTMALWRFALDAARGEARRKLFSWSYLKERHQRRITYLRLLRQAHGKDRDRVSAERAAIERASTYDEMRCIFTIHQLRKRSVNGPISTTCASCEKRTRTRLTCLQCSGKFAVDFCEAASCRDASIPGEEGRMHLPSHDIVKIRRDFFYYRDMGKILRTVRRVHERLSGGSPQEDQGKKPAACVSCRSPVQRPYWYCIDCNSDTFVCEECDLNKGGVTAEGHVASHILLRCLPVPVDTNVSVEERLSSLEARVASFTTRFDSLDDRLARIERLLEMVVSGRTIV
ncbi:hypothetical protein OH77DRAFT_1418971 [Trametes cingulata]|nr:hypothetical protein OH77DRAFT_1418971 [Trametes cingulata]